MANVCRFPGVVTEFDGISKHRVVYHDGDEDWYNLAKEKVKFEPEIRSSKLFLLLKALSSIPANSLTVKLLHLPIRAASKALPLTAAYAMQRHQQKQLLLRSASRLCCLNLTTNVGKPQLLMTAAIGAKLQLLRVKKMRMTMKSAWRSHQPAAVTMTPRLELQARSARSARSQRLRMYAVGVTFASENDGACLHEQYLAR